MTASDYTDRLRQLMLRVNLGSWTSLYRATRLPRYQIQRLRQGQIQTLPVASLVTLSQVLQTPLAQLLEQFTSIEEPLPVGYDSKASEQLTLKAEYRRLQQELEQQEQDLEHVFQQAVLQILEPLLLQWPTAAYAAQQNPQAPAIKLLPLLRPLDQLLQSWGIEAIGIVGEETTYDPQWHQPLEGAIAIHAVVRVRYVGYRRGEQLIYRAKVSLVGT